MIFGTTCLELCKKLEIGEWTWCNRTSESHFEITLKELDKLIKLKIVANGTKGGLVIGNLHSEGGIHLFHPISDDRLRYLGEMEGWEYLTSPLKKQELRDEFIRINEETKNQGRHIKTEFKIPKNCGVIDVTGIEVPFIIILDQHFIINRFATKKRIKELIELDIKNNI